MKSDKEFLDGIYEKAKQYKDENLYLEENHDKKYYHYLKPALITGFLLASCITLVLTVNLRNNNKVEPINDSDSPGKIRSITPVEQHIPSPSNFSLDIDSNVMILEGRIKNIDSKNKTFTLNDIIIYEGDVIVDKEEVVYFSDFNIDNISLEENQKILVFVKETEDKFYLENGDYSIYTHMEEGSDFDLYEGIDGSVIDTRTLKNG